jgi:ribonuclease P protein component
MPTFTHTARLSQPEHYRRVFDSPEYKVSSGAFLLLAAPGATRSSRLGVVVAKKAIRRAVRRNRIKRLVREQFRHHPFDKAIDLVVLARSGADQMDNPDVWSELDRLWRALGQKVNP